jgi:hypothetical protein
VASRPAPQAPPGAEERKRRGSLLSDLDMLVRLGSYFQFIASDAGIPHLPLITPNLLATGLQSIIGVEPAHAGRHPPATRDTLSTSGNATL